MMDSNPLPFFVMLTGGLLKAEFRGYVPGPSYGEMESAFRGELHPQKPFLVRHDMGRELYDFLYVSMLPILSDRVVDLLLLGAITGWGTYPVQVLDKNGKTLQNYSSGLSITGRCRETRLDKEHSRIVYEELPGGRVPSYRGLYVSTDSWDGSDIFISQEGTSHIVVTARMRDLFAKANVTNVGFVPVEDVEVIAMDQPRFPKQLAG